MAFEIYTLTSDSLLNSWLNNLGYSSFSLPDTYPSLKPHAKERPCEFAYRLSCEKMKVLISNAPLDSLLISTVKVITCGRRILTIPENRAEARKMLVLLSGRRHQSFMILSVYHQGTVRHRDVLTRVSFKRLSHQEIEDYLHTTAWCDHAGGYDILGRGATFIKAINGSIGGVWGIPAYELASLLEGVKNGSRC